MYELKYSNIKRNQGDTPVNTNKTWIIRWIVVSVRNVWIVSLGLFIRMRIIHRRDCVVICVLVVIRVYPHTTTVMC